MKRRLSWLGTRRTSRNARPISWALVIDAGVSAHSGPIGQRRNPTVQTLVRLTCFLVVGEATSRPGDGEKRGVLQFLSTAAMGPFVRPNGAP